MSEKALIELLKEADESAFRQVVESFQDKIYNTCLHFLRDTGEAEDITQEVFIEVYRSVNKFKGNSSLSTWIYRIASNKCLEYQRYKKRKRRQAFFQSLLGIDEAREYLEQKSVEYRHPGVQLEEKERSEEMFRAIDCLPESQRLAFTLHHIDGMSYKEIAEIMEKSVSSVESLLFRAKQNLRKKLEKMYRTSD
ncbi:MAG: RNA polymerase sigma factor [Bacteroidetes bacterium]|nr:RNA polymerase sigma factor [Bacteroidota bacterium]